jgi:tetratricopeptide (TPR) repeat protein
VHLLELAFLWRADSTRIAQELEAYTRLAPDEPRTRAARIAFELAFGSNSARDTARAELATSNAEAAFQVYEDLQHPRFADMRNALVPVILPLLDGIHRTALIRSHLFDLGFMDGRLHQALAILADPATPAVFRSCGPLYFEARGFPVPLEALVQGRAVTQADTALLSWGVLRCAADYAARFGDWKEHAALLARARMMSASALASDDTLRGRDWHALASGIEGYGLLRRGQKAEALRAFEDCLPGSDEIGQQCVWFVGALALDLGKLDVAERAFGALWHHQGGAPARLQLARILERRGRTAEALDAYRYVADAWRDADPELQPMADEARQAIVHLSPVDR